MMKLVIELLKEILKEMGVSGIEPVVEIPDDSSHGDYSTSVALKVSKILKKPAMEVALQVAEKLNAQISAAKAGSLDHTTGQRSQIKTAKISANRVLQDIDHVDVIKPGFINVWLTEAKLRTELAEVLNEAERYGTGRQKGAKTGVFQKIIVEFTDPNPFKEFHVGHLYSNAVGESLSRLLEFCGNTVRRVNYQGDVGIHVAKAIWGMKKLLQNKNLPAGEAGLTRQNLETKRLTDRVKFLGQSYALGATAYEEDEKAKEEIKNINYLVFIAAQEYLAENEGWQPQVDYRQHVTVKEEELRQVRELYEKGRDWSLEYFEALYQRLGTKFDGYYFESIAGEYGARIVREHIVDGIFEESAGAVVFRGEKYASPAGGQGLHTRVFINSLGLPTYEAKELGLAPTKYQDFPYDLSLIVTGNEINEYFKVLIAALTAVSPDLGKKTRHIGHGMVRLPEGKMSSRTGRVLTGEWLIEKTKRRITNILQKSASNYLKEDQEFIAEKAAVAAVKYSLLKVALPSDIRFDLAKSVSFAGDSGPYLQYAYARCKSVLRKSPKSPKGLDQTVSNSPSISSEERSVLRLIWQFPERVAEAADNLTPNTLCSYLFRLAQAFNLFYAKHSILGTAKDEKISYFRIKLTAATAQVLKNGLYLLGIETVERM